ncbi:MAG: decaprenyl-phosphate phosphoribosyltransferase [Capsulimonadales bacterium]|nr:decaprenyl-phosphate phosphoribosyltransferase [Capsulimonadales bacterium]
MVSEKPPVAVSPLSLIAAMRPRQWVKNGLLFAGLLFTLNEAHPVDAYLRVVLGFVLFCLLSGTTYLINDLKDVEADRQHPKKRMRPIASGALPLPMAIGAVIVLVPLTLTLAYLFLGIPFFLTAFAYFVMTLAYSLALKHVVLIDVMTVAAGFVLRAVAGACAVPVEPSPWLLVLAFLLALFIGLNKRRAELVALGGNTPTRKILAEYSVAFLDPMITLVATTCLVTYLLYTVLSTTGKQHPYLMATAFFVLYGLFRYLYLIHQKGMGEAPEIALGKDRPLQFNLLLWIGAVAAAILV